MAKVLRNNNIYDDLSVNNKDLYYRVSSLENNELKVVYYNIVSNTSLTGNITLPSYSKLSLEEYGNFGTIITSKLTSTNKVSFDQVLTSGGSIVTASINYSNNTYTLSGSPADRNIALIFTIIVKSKYYSYVNKDFIITSEKLNSTGGGSGGSYSFASPLLNSGGVIMITKSDTSTNGYLSSTDWNTFNNKQNTITLTTTGTSGAATLSGNTLNIPQYSGGISNITANTPLVYNSGTLSINQSNTTTDGYLSSTDWNTFNNKEPAVNSGLINQFYRGDKTFSLVNYNNLTGTLNVPNNSNVSPLSGDLWYNGTSLFFRNGTTNVDILNMSITGSYLPLSYTTNQIVDGGTSTLLFKGRGYTLQYNNTSSTNSGNVLNLDINTDNLEQEGIRIDYKKTSANMVYGIKAISGSLTMYNPNGGIIPPSTTQTDSYYDFYSVTDVDNKNVAYKKSLLNNNVLNTVHIIDSTGTHFYNGSYSNFMYVGGNSGYNNKTLVQFKSSIKGIETPVLNYTNLITKCNDVQSNSDINNQEFYSSELRIPVSIVKNTNSGATAGSLLFRATANITEAEYLVMKSTIISYILPGSMIYITAINSGSTAFIINRNYIYNGNNVWQLI